jgi:hypothetical protein
MSAGCFSWCPQWIFKKQIAKKKPVENQVMETKFDEVGNRFMSGCICVQKDFSFTGRCRIVEDRFPRKPRLGALHQLQVPQARDEQVNTIDPAQVQNPKTDVTC